MNYSNTAVMHAPKEKLRYMLEKTRRIVGKKKIGSGKNKMTSVPP